MFESRREEEVVNLCMFLFCFFIVCNVSMDLTLVSEINHYYYDYYYCYVASHHNQRYLTTLVDHVDVLTRSGPKYFYPLISSSN